MPSPAFEHAIKLVQSLPQGNVDQDLQLRFYGLYKQATVGDAPPERPTGMLAFVAKSKWDAWDKHRGMAAAEAEGNYVELLKQWLPGVQLQE